MATRVSSKHSIYSMNAANLPALEITSGEQVIFETMDWFGTGTDYAKLLYDNAGGVDINPATGPVSVQGAKPGDTLKIDILKIDLTDKGKMFCIPGIGVLGHLIKELETKNIYFDQNVIHYNEKITIPVQPMIGVIGTAPSTGDIPCYIPGPHGGNMDTRYVKAGSRIYLPVFVEGGLLALGDLHAAMADGEVSDWGLETSGNVTVRVSLIKQKSLGIPVIETEDDFFIVYSDEDLNLAVKKAIEAGFNYLKQRTDLSSNDLISLLSLICPLEISQIVKPLKTVRIRIPKKRFANYQIGF